MSKIISFFYNLLFVPFFFVLIHLVGLYNDKVKRGLKGRKNLFVHLRKQLDQLDPNHNRVWIHISSMGELEQGRPVIEELQKRIPDVQIILTIFSPSAYDHILFQDKNIVLSYLPIDTWRNADQFLSITKPNVAMIVRHDIWPNFMWGLEKRKIPILLIDASVADKRKLLYKNAKYPLRMIFSIFSWVLTVSDESRERFLDVFPFPEKILTYGDTRYDRVVQRSLNNSKVEFLHKGGYFIREKTLVAGSTWPGDEKVLLPAVLETVNANPDFKMIIAPHEPTPEHLEGVEEFCIKNNIKMIRLSNLNEGTRNFQLLLIDKIGLLANLYSLGLLAYVGGGFGPGVHNVLEPAAHGCAVLYGPRYTVSVEPQLLINSGGAHVINSEADALTHLRNLCANNGEIQKIGQAARLFIQNNTGASSRIADKVKTLL